MQKKILAFVLAAMLTASAMPATALASIEIAGAEETAITALSGANTVDTFNGTIVSTGVDSTSVDGSLVGEVIGAGAAADNFTAAFDGNPATQSAALAENWAPDVDYWMGIKFPAAVKATEIRIAVANHSKIFGSYIQASNDGINWTTLKEFSDWRDYADTAEGGYWAKGDTYKSIALSGDAEYTYFRYFNYDDQGGNWLDEFQVYGTMVGVVLPNTIDTYNGTINYSGIKATSVDGSLAGEVISGGVGYAAVSAAFDGDMTTQASFDANYGTDVSYWMGMKADKPVIPLSFRLAAANAGQQSKIAGSYIQASNDGVNWTTLWQYSDWREYATPAEGGSWAEGTYKVISVSTTETYQYFRYFNYNDDGANRLTEFQVVGVEPTNNTVDVYEGDIVYTGITATPIGGSVAGEIIGGGADASALAPAFDGNLSTLGSIGTNVATDVSYWMGLKMEEAIVPTAFALTLPSGQHFRIMGSYIQGSNDGVNWTTLEVFDDWRDYATFDEGGVWVGHDNYKFVEVDTTEAYQYYRYFNYADQGGNRLGEFLVFADGAAVAGAENNVVKYNGDIVYTGVMSTVDEGLRAAEIIGAGVDASAITGISDGSSATGAMLASNGEAIDIWVGLKFAAPVVAREIKFKVPDGQSNSKIMGSYFQGSNDGVNWETIKVINNWRDYATPAEGGNWAAGDYKFIEPNGQAYQYYRYFNRNDVGANRIGEFQVVVSDGWMTPDYVEIDTSTRDNTAGTLSMTESEDGETVTISYELADGTVVTYEVPNNAQYIAGPLAGTDDLGRDMYTMEDVIELYENVDSTHNVGVVADDHEVGIFYFLLHGHHGDAGKLNITDILAEGGEAAKSANYEGWGNVGDIHYVAEPLYGYYYSEDEWVIRKHMELLTNAGVDFLYFDMTNGYADRYSDEIITIMSVLHEMNMQGYDAPEVVAYTNTDAGATIATLYNNIYSKNLYPDTWYMVDGKPLVIAPADVSVSSFFSVRYTQWPTEAKLDNAWPWIDWNVAQDVFVNADGEAEAMNVSVAQHSGVNGEGGWFSESGVYGQTTNRGRSWVATYDANGDYVGTRANTTADSYKNGYNFQSQFNYAISKDVPVVLVTGWNEWVAQRLDPSLAAVTGQEDRVLFVDNCTLEFSRDIEMTRGYYFDNYYMQLAANVQALKGAAPDVVQDMRKTINTTGDFDQWNDVIVTYTDVEGDTINRAHGGYGNEWYTDESGRNDIVAAKVTADNTNLYFYVQTAENVTYFDNASSWMKLYVNVDRDTTGWYGYDYIITDTITSETTAKVAALSANGKSAAGEATIRVAGNEMMVAVPLSVLGISNYKNIDIEFKWADSETVIDEMEDFYTEGDAAPLGRMNYVFTNYKVSTLIEDNTGSNEPEVTVDNTLTTYGGDIVYTGVQSTSVDASLVGEIIGGGADASALVNAFDGELGTVTVVGDNFNDVVDYWFGLKLSEPVVPSIIRIAMNPHYQIHKGYIQASNDGINWTTLKALEDWREYATPGEGGYWPADEDYRELTTGVTTAYQYYRYFKYNDGGNQLSEFQVFGPDGIIITLPENNINKYEGEIVYTGVNSTSVEGSLVGEIIGAGADASALTAAFDGDLNTITDLPSNFDDVVENWFGIKLAEATVPTAFRVAIEPHHNIFKGYIQGSNDGINWTTIKDFENWREYATPSEGGYWAADETYRVITVNTADAYQYYRYCKYNDSGNRLSEFQVFGPNGILNNSITSYIGEITYTGVKSTSVDGSLVGEVIGGGAAADVLTAAFDGSTTTITEVTANSGEEVLYWFGLKFSSPVIPTSIRVAIEPHHNIYMGYVQASKDGVQWTTLKDFTNWREYATPAEGGYWAAEDTYKVVDITTEEEYQYFRYFKYNDGGNRLAEFQVFGLSTHTHAMTFTAAADATCAATGNVAYYYCEGCNTYFADEAGARELATVETPINPDNHVGETEIRDKVDATATTPGYTGDTYCLACGNKIADGEEISATGLGGTFGEAGTWELANGVLTIGGEGAMPNYTTASTSAPWGKYRAEITKIVIGSGITSIGNYAFYQMKNAATIEFEAGSAVTTIATGAFGYAGVTALEIPASVEFIDKNAFYYCSELTVVTFEEGSVLEEIGNYAFRACTALTTITFPERIVTIGSSLLYQAAYESVVVAEGSVAHAYAVANKYNYTTYTGTYTGFCGESATWVLAADGTLYINGTGAMSDYTSSTASAPWGSKRAQVKAVVIGNGVTYIGAFAFYNMKNLTSVTFASTSKLEIIGESAFGQTTALTSVELPASLKKVGDKSFQYSGIKTVTFMANSKLETIDRFAFRNCASLESVYIPSKILAIGDKILYSANADAALLVPMNSLGQTYATANGYKMIVREETLSGSCGPNATWTLTPDGVLTIGGTGSLNVFGTSYKTQPWGTNRAYIKKVVIGNGITDITNFAFYYCSALETVEFEAGSSVKTINTSPFSFTGLKSIEIPASVELIGKNAFAFNNNLTSVTFEEGSALKEIRNYAFQSNPALEYICLPESVETFGAVVIYLAGGTNASVDVALGTPAYRYAVAQKYRNIALRGTEPSGTCGDNATWAFDYATGTLTIGGSGAMADYAYSSASAKAAPYACTLLNLRSFITKIVIGKDITSIGEYAFYSMANATEVVFEEGSALTTISTGAFGYAGLKTVEIPASVTDIEKNAFYYAPALTTVTFAADSALANVGSYAFRDCKALTTCVFPAGATIGASVFYNCPNMK